MKTLIRTLKHAISTIAPDLPDSDAKTHLRGLLEKFGEDVKVAGRVIGVAGGARVRDGERVMTYGGEGVIEVFAQALLNGTTFSVVVVDSRPRLEGT